MLAKRTPPRDRLLALALSSLAAIACGSSGGDAPAFDADRIRVLAPSPVARKAHLTMPLADGGALAMGGNTSESVNVPDSDTSQRFDPVAETFSPGPPLAFSAMAGFTLPAQLQGGGFLLVGGGINSGAQLGGDGGLATQLFDPSTGAFRRVGDLASGHLEGATAVLPDGGALVTGGEVPPVAAAERYDPSTELWTGAGDMLEARRGHTATTLRDGRVLLAGGVVCCGPAGELLTGTAELYDPDGGGFVPTGALGTARAFHTATLLADGRVLVAGGLVDAATSTPSTEIYDPATGRFGPAGTMQVDRVGHAAVLLADGRVLVLGGERRSIDDVRGRVNAATDLYEPAGGRWSAGPSLQPAWGGATATLLPAGKVLVFGGEDAQGFPVSTVMVFERSPAR